MILAATTDGAPEFEIEKNGGLVYGLSDGMLFWCGVMFIKAAMI